MIHRQMVISVINIKMLYSQQLMWVCNIHMGYVDKGDKMVNTYSVQHWTLKWSN